MKFHGCFAGHLSLPRSYLGVQPWSLEWQRPHGTCYTHGLSSAHEINQDGKLTSWIDWQIFYSSSLNTHCSYREIMFTYLQWKVLKTLNYLCNTGRSAFKSIQGVLILGFSYLRRTIKQILLGSAAPLQWLSKLLRNCFRILITTPLLNSHNTLCASAAPIPHPTHHVHRSLLSPYPLWYLRGL